MGPDWLNFLVMNIFLYFSDSLGKGQATKSDEFSEKFRTACDPLISENYIAIFLW